MSVNSVTVNSVKTSPYEILSFVCNAIVPTKLYCFQSSDYVKATTAPAFLIKNIKFKQTFRANPLYPSQSEMDFLLCFRYEV